MFTANLLAAKFMVDVPWADAFRRTFYRGHTTGDYTLTSAAWYLATLAALVEMLVPLLTWTCDFWLVRKGSSGSHTQCTRVSCMPALCVCQGSQ